MRIFIGIDLDPEVRGRISRFLEGVQGFAPEERWVRPESLHVTLSSSANKSPSKSRPSANVCAELRAARSIFALADMDTFLLPRLLAYSGSELKLVRK